jgi:putative intracellular protease/amidase
MPAADPRVLCGDGLGLGTPFLRCRKREAELYRDFERAPCFERPLAYEDLQESAFDALVLPGGHAPGMKEFLDSEILHTLTARFFAQDKPVAAICHGVLVVARSVAPTTGRSVLHGKKTTALPNFMELAAWLATYPWRGDYIRTYRTTVQDEVESALAHPGDFHAGPKLLVRDSAGHPERGFAVVDGNYVSARWPGDAYRFTQELLRLLERRGTAPGPRPGVS